MARPEAEIDASTPEGRFALGLRALRKKKQLDYQTMAKIAHFAPSTLSKAASGNGLPTLDVTLAYVRACGGSQLEWERKWRELHVELGRRRSAQEATDRFPPIRVQAVEPERPPGKRAVPFRRWLVLLLVLVVVGGAGSVTLTASRYRTALMQPTPTAVQAPVGQPFVIWDRDGSVFSLVEGKTTRRVNVRNSSSGKLVVTRLNAWLGRLPNGATSAPSRCYTEFVEILPPQLTSEQIAPGGTMHFEFEFVASSSIPGNCKGRNIRVDYTGEAVQGATVGGQSPAS